MKYWHFQQNFKSKTKQDVIYGKLMIENNYIISEAYSNLNRKYSTLRPATLLKRDSNTGIFM